MEALETRYRVCATTMTHRTSQPILELYLADGLQRLAIRSGSGSIPAVGIGGIINLSSLMTAIQRRRLKADRATATSSDRSFRYSFRRGGRRSQKVAARATGAARRVPGRAAPVKRPSFQTMAAVALTAIAAYGSFRM